MEAVRAVSEASMATEDRKSFPPHVRPGDRSMRTLVALVLIGLSLWVIETARSGVEVTRSTVGETPRDVLRGHPVPTVPSSSSPTVSAGSSQMMQG